MNLSMTKTISINRFSHCSRWSLRAMTLVNHRYELGARAAVGVVLSRELISPFPSPCIERWQEMRFEREI